MSDEPIRWIPVTERLPIRVYTVVVWVTKGRLVLEPNKEGYLDVGAYFPVEGAWHVNNGLEDEIVEVSHWMDVPYIDEDGIDPDDARPFARRKKGRLRADDPSPFRRRIVEKR